MMNDGKLILEGKLELLSPLHIGSGENDSTDLDVIMDCDEKPFITFTSFIGALQHHLKKNYTTVDSEMKKLFGFTKDDASQGSVIIGTDLFLCKDTKGAIATRDGIKIDLKTGIVADKAKYDYQIVDKGAKFSFKLEAAYSSQPDKISKQTLLQYYATILEMLKTNDNNNQQYGLRIGAKTNNGLGKIRLIDEKLYDYDFSDYKNVIAWLKGDKLKPYEIKNPEKFKRKEEDLIIDAYLDLKTSLIQRSYNDDPSMPDASHIQSNGKNILTGSGTKGAISARAKRIINTIWANGEQSKLVFIDRLFGYVNDPNDKQDIRKDKKPKKAKLQIEERELPAYVAELQSRIKIDRFTGGTINGALFDSMPLFNTKELIKETDLGKKYTRITIRVRDCTEAEAGLMLLVLKDLWTGDLAIGGEKGIGRGVFNGVSASIKFQNKTITLEQSLNNLSELQKYVDALVKEAGGEK